MRPSLRTERPPSPAWRRTRIALAVAIPLLVAFAVLRVSRTTHDICAACYSARSTLVEGWGTDPFDPWKETGRREDVRPSWALRDFFGGECAHRWERFSTRGSFFVFMTMTPAKFRPQPVAEQYENVSRFHSHAKKQIESGAWTAEEFRAACSLPAELTEADLADPARRALVKRCVQVLQDAGAPGSWDAWEKAYLRTLPGASGSNVAKPR